MRKKINDIRVDVINVECDPEESNQCGIEPAPMCNRTYRTLSVYFWVVPSDSINIPIVD